MFRGWKSVRVGLSAAVLLVPCTFNLHADTKNTCASPAALAAASTAPASSVEPQATSSPAMSLARDTPLIEIFCAMAVILVLYPIGRFLVRQWSFRADRLFGALAGDPVVYYYQQFRPGGGPSGPTPQKLDKPVDGNWYPEAVWRPYMQTFCRDFYLWYGRRYYIAPVLMLTVLTVVSGYWAQKMLRDWAAMTAGPGASLRALTASALAGAFVWVVSDELDRLRRRDFTTSDVYYYIFRILLAIPFAWALSAVKDTDGHLFGLPAAIPLAFFLGAFPTTTLFTIARRIGSQQLKLGDDPKTGNELEKLQAITKSNAERFKDEGIATITELAYADPIDLTIRTNFDFNYVVDCVSQALAWIYFGDDCAKVFAISLRGAQEIVSLANAAANAADPDARTRANNTIDAAAALLKVDKDGLRSALDQIARDPYSEFLVNVWS